MVVYLLIWSIRALVSQVPRARWCFMTEYQPRTMISMGFIGVSRFRFLRISNVQTICHMNSRFWRLNGHDGQLTGRPTPPEVNCYMCRYFD